MYHLSKEPRLAGKVAVISGAARGFGQSIALRFLEEGASLVLVDLLPCEETTSLMTSQIDGVDAAYVESHVLYVRADISSEADTKRVVEEATAKFGAAIHVLVNNAALFVFASVEDATAEDWDRSAAVNIKGHALLTKACLPAMKKTKKEDGGHDVAGGGSIVWMGSISSFLGQPNCATYATMKGAIVQVREGVKLAHTHSLLFSLSQCRRV